MSSKNSLPSPAPAWAKFLTASFYGALVARDNAAYLFTPDPSFAGSLSKLIAFVLFKSNRIARLLVIFIFDLLLN